MDKCDITAYLDSFDASSLSFVDVGLFPGDEVQDNPGHHHDCFELLYHTAGQGNIETSDGLQPVKAYDFVLIPPGVDHREHGDPFFRKALIWLRFKARHTIAYHQLIRLSDRRGYMRHDVEMLLDEAEGARDSCILTLRLQLIFDQIKRIASEPLEHEDPAAWLAAHLDDYYMQPIHLGDLARRMGLSSSYLSVLFTRRYSMPPGQYLLRKRIDAAKESLQLKNMSVAEVARSCGFSDPLYFSRLFKREVGMPPSRYQAKSKGLK